MPDALEGPAAAAPPQGQGPEFGNAAERGLTTPRAAGVAGIVFAVLFVVALALLAKVVGVALDTQTVMDNLSGSGSTPALIGLYMVPFAGIAFLWFIGVIRDRVGVREDKFFATVFLGSGLLFVAMLFAGAAVLGGLIAGNRFGIAAPTDIPTVGFARSVGYSFLFVYSAKVAGVFMLATSTIVRRVALAALDVPERLPRRSGAHPERELLRADRPAPAGLGDGDQRLCAGDGRPAVWEDGPLKGK